MSRLKIFIGGIHGVGKSLLCKELVKYLMGEYVSASELLRWNDKSKFVDNVQNNQVILKKLLRYNTSNDSSYVIDGHFALWNTKNKCEAVPIEVFSSLNLSVIIVVTCLNEIVQKRLELRDKIVYKIEDIDALQQLEIKQAKNIAKRLQIPLILVDTSKDIDVNNITKQIEIMKKTYRRDNILSKMLKTLIIRVDFEELTGVKEFVNIIKGEQEMQNAFERMNLLSQQEMRVSFRPKDLFEGQLPITDNQRRNLYHFYDCKLEKESKATLDIESSSITLAVDCQNNYRGSKSYSDFMVWIINRLWEYDKYLSIKRLGVRKIDVQVLEEGETIEKYFNEKYFVAQSWKESPKTLSTLTDFLNIEDMYFNVVQRIDFTSDNRTRLIYDVDAFILEETLRSSKEQLGGIKEILYKKMQDQMFDFFVNVVSEDYLKECKIKE